MNLRERRNELGLTQKNVAEASGIRTSSYCDIENGKKGTKPATAMKIAAVLKFRWTEFYEEGEDARKQEE